MKRSYGRAIAVLALIAVSAAAFAIWLQLRPDPEVTTRTVRTTEAGRSDIVPADPSSEAAARGRVREPGRAKRLRKSAPTPPAPRQVAVEFDRAPDSGDLTALGKQLGFTVVHEIPSIRRVVVAPSAGVSLPALESKLQKVHGVRGVERASLVYPTAAPDDEYYSNQWGYANTGQWGGVTGVDSNVESAWDWSRGDGVVVAVTDTGIDAGHPELSGKLWVNPADPADGVDNDGNGMVDDTNGWDFYHDDGSVFDLADGDKHGTHVAGTIGAATNNGAAVAGMGWNARIMALKFLGPHAGSDLDGAAAIDYAVHHGARIINASWGGSTYSATLAASIAHAASHNALVVVAAGNNNVNTDVTPDYPASLPATNVVSVAAITTTGARAGFSNYGATSVDLGAPGQDILSTMSRLPSALYVDRAPYRLAYLAFPAESITSIGARRDVIGNSALALAGSPANPVLVVDDSRPSATWETPGQRLFAYTDALSAKGFSAVSTWSTETSGTPSAAAMAGKTVVWFTGAATFGFSNYAGVGTLAAPDRTQIGAFLDGGGRLLMVSGDLGYDMLDQGSTAYAWYQNYFRAVFVGDDPWTSTFHGRAGTWLQGVTAQIDDPLRYPDGFDDVAPLDSYASTIADWDGYTYLQGTSMAAPHVSGALALALARNPSLDATDLKARLLARTVPTPSLAGVTVSGGRLDAAAVVGTLTAPAPLQVGHGLHGALQLTWTNPGEPDFVATRVLVRSDAPPTGPTDPSATELHDGSDSATTYAGASVGQTLHFAAYSRGTFGAWSEAARVTTSVAEPPAGPGAPIPVGTDVSVTVDGVTVTFPRVTSPGWLSVTRMEPRAEPPANLIFVPSGYYEIHAVGDYEMPADITVPFAPPAVRDTSRLRFHHLEGSVWRDVTVSVDEAGHVHARTPSFSDFALTEPSATAEPQDLAAEKPWTAPVAALVVFVAMSLAGARQRRGA